VITVRNLTVRYGPHCALDGVNLDVAAGECVLVTGPSGCGKSTLARVLTGIVPHALPAAVSGRVEVAGRDVWSHTVAEMAQTVGFVFQDPSSQLFHLLVEDDVAFGPRNLGLDEAAVAERVDWALAAVGAEPLRRRRSAELSGGEKQLVAIAAALAMQPAVLVLDEPTASLDVAGAGRVVESLATLRRRFGLTVIIIEHRLADVYGLVDRAVVLEEGRIAAAGPIDDVFADREMMWRLGLRRPAEQASTPWEQLLAPDGHDAALAGPLLSLRGVTAGYNGREAIQGIDLDLRPGEFAALVGDNGAGKSTLALTIAGLLRPTAGQMRFGDRKRPRPGLDVSLLFQHPPDQLLADSVEEEIGFGPRNCRRFDATLHERILTQADLLGLRQRPLATLSVGQQQRTALAAAVALQPRLLILDEPTLGQDWGHLQQLMRFLTELNAAGMTILLITHDYKLVHRYARRVLLMDAGRIVLDGTLRNGAAPEETQPQATAGERT
jgi:energy-coupling factor transport system ATP-binding protein